MDDLTKWESILEEEGLTMAAGSPGNPEQRDAILEYLSDLPPKKERILDNLDSIVSKLMVKESVTSGFQTQDTYIQLRKVFDSSDGFVAGGHATRGSANSKHVTRLAKIPTWTNDNKKVQLLLLVAFPKLKKTDKQRAKAARWAQVIQLYYRMGLPMGRVSKILGITVNSVNQILLRIRATAKRTIDSNC